MPKKFPPTDPSSPYPPATVDLYPVSVVLPFQTVAVLESHNIFGLPSFT